MRCRAAQLTAAAICALVTAACVPANSRTRPLSTSPVATGEGSTRSERSALEGRWLLVSLDVTAPDGRQVGPEATGEMILDEFGNIRIEYQLSEAGQRMLEGVGVHPPNPVISASGRVVIDPQNARVTYVAPDSQARLVDADLAARRANPFALEHQREYAIAADGMLTLTSRYEDGRHATISVWRKSN